MFMDYHHHIQQQQHHIQQIQLETQYIDANNIIYQQNSQNPIMKNYIYTNNPSNNSQTVDQQQIEPAFYNDHQTQTPYITIPAAVIQNQAYNNNNNIITTTTSVTPTPITDLPTIKAQLRKQLEYYLCVGGYDIKTQEAALRMRPDICIATPGRLIDHLHNTPCFNHSFWMKLIAC
jgi:hypothetical protein